LPSVLRKIITWGSRIRKPSNNLRRRQYLCRRLLKLLLLRLGVGVFGKKAYLKGTRS
jgi:hypothetical protein